jgi:hypothetical protein
VATLIRDEDFYDLPEDPDLAFLQLEKEFRALADKQLETADNNSSYDTIWQTYMNSTLAAARELGITYFERWERPPLGRDLYENYRSFSLAASQYTTQVRIRHSRRAKRYSVALDAATKQKIKHHLDQLKEIAGSLELSLVKRESILGKILALEMEMARERTRFEVIAALVLESATVVGQAGEKLEPWRKWIGSITNLFGLAKDKDVHNPSLPSPEERKQIEPPKRQLPAPPSVNDVDDDVPF